MRKINPWTKFFSADLIPDENEIGNAFWGYHVANNIGRLLNLDGTVFFNPAGTSTGLELYDKSVARIPIEMCEFRTAPAVQLAAQVDISPTAGTTYFFGTFDGGMLENPISDVDAMVSVRYNKWLFDEGEPYVNNFMRLGTANEIMRINQYFIDVRATCVIANYYVERNAIVGGTAYAYNMGGGEVQVFRTNYEGIDYVAPSAGESQYVLNPIFCEAIIEPTQLKIFWGHDFAGTVYFKLFGI